MEKNTHDVGVVKLDSFMYRVTRGSHDHDGERTSDFFNHEGRDFFCILGSFVALLLGAAVWLFYPRVQGA